MHTYSKDYRLLSKSDFQNLRSGSRFLVSDLAISYTKKSESNNSRLGIAVSKKFGNAIQRNKFKRRVRESFRKSDFKNSHYDCLITPNLKVIKKKKMSFDEIWLNLDSSLDQLFDCKSL